MSSRTLGRRYWLKKRCAMFVLRPDVKILVALIETKNYDLN